MSGQSQHLLIGKSGSLKKTWQVAFEINRLLLLPNHGIFYEVGKKSIRNSILQASNLPPPPPDTKKTKKKAGLLFCSWAVFIFGMFSPVSKTAVFTILIFLGMGQRKNPQAANIVFKNYFEEILFAIKHIKYKYFLRWCTGINI